MLSKAAGIIPAILLLIAGNAFAFDTLRVDASLDTLRKDISGSVTFVLPMSPDLSSFELQLFPNVYASEDSPYLLEKKILREQLKSSGKWGEMVLDSILLDGNNITNGVTVEYTRAVYRSKTGKNINGGQVDVYFRTRLPERGDRLSTFGGNYFLDGWFPYPAIVQEDGSWYNPDYNSFAELVGNFYQYEINLRLPGNLKIASAVPPEIIAADDSLVTNHFSFGPAHDFGLVLAPDFEVDSTSIDGINVVIYYRPGDLPVIERIRTAAGYVIEFMQENVGPYPYDRLTLAVFDLVTAGGVEMPGLIALNTSHGVMAKMRIFEVLVVHETLHQWFYGAIYSDQAAAPWMDEAISDVFTLKIMEKVWGIDANVLDFAGFRISERDQVRLVSQMSADNGPLNRPTSEFIDDVDYVGTVYMRGALLIETFDNLLGDSLSMLFWHSYYDRYKFGCPTPDDFVELAGEIGGDGIKSAVDYLVNHAGQIDYAVKGLANKQIDSVTYESEFVLKKKGELNLSIDYRMILYNGDTLDQAWEPQRKTEKMIFRLPAPVMEVIVDPDNIITVDDNLANNSITDRTDSRAALRLSSGVMFLIESIFSFLGGL
ncbi:MAG: hypothetical protein CVT49_07855 [candidate division Zixibacteria bacterium HGW-Zixibacteria-1]|nr:MAG: hypothetical protein CVT49_07855 [candidate division Zixibacteria bacterium HGW-Zixibacteria-1]